MSKEDPGGLHNGRARVARRHDLPMSTRKRHGADASGPSPPAGKARGTSRGLDAGPAAPETDIDGRRSSACYGPAASRHGIVSPVPDHVPEPPRGVPPVRFLMEITAWVAVPWALVGVSIPLAVIAVAVLIGLPTVFQTPGDKPRVTVPVPGYVTVGLLVLQLVAGVAAAWAAWWAPVALVVTVLAAVTVVTELRRWRWLLTGRI